MDVQGIQNKVKFKLNNLQKENGHIHRVNNLKHQYQ